MSRGRGLLVISTVALLVLSTVVTRITELELVYDNLQLIALG